MAGVKRKGMYAQFERGTFGNLERTIERDGFVADEELAETLRRHRGEPIPDKVLDYLCARLEGTIKKPRGRKRVGPIGEIRVAVARLYYKRYLMWLQRRKRRCDLEGWPRIKKADWWDRPPHERAARMTAHKLRRIWPNVSYRHIQNLASSKK